MTKEYVQGYTDCYNQFSHFLNEAVKMVDAEPNLIGFNKAINHVINAQHSIKLATDY